MCVDDTGFDGGRLDEGRCDVTGRSSVLIPAWVDKNNLGGQTLQIPDGSVHGQHDEWMGRV